MHISEQVAALLIEQGWQYRPQHMAQPHFTKRITFPELAGTVSNGARVVTLTICERGRYLSHVDGWGIVEKDVDLREYLENPKGAIDEVLKY